MIKIDKNFPIPVSIGRPLQKVGMSASLRAMDVGDSFFIEPQKRPGIFTKARHCGVQIKTRKEGDGFRVWKTGHCQPT